MDIVKIIAQPIAELAVWLEETYQVDVTETIAKWHELSGMKITVKDNEIIPEPVQSLDVDSTSRNGSSKKIPKTREVCQHIYHSGQKVGEQCTTKPKGGAIYCSAHKPKESATKSVVKDKKKVPKKKEVEKINPEFQSDDEKVEDEPNKEENNKIEIDNEKGEDEPKKEKKIKQKEVKDKIKKKNKIVLTDDSDAENEPQNDKKKVEFDNDTSEPETPVKPLLKKKTSKKPVAKPVDDKHYNTDEEALDKNLSLESDEE